MQQNGTPFPSHSAESDHHFSWFCRISSISMDRFCRILFAADSGKIRFCRMLRFCRLLTHNKNWFCRISFSAVFFQILQNPRILQTSHNMCARMSWPMKTLQVKIESSIRWITWKIEEQTSWSWRCFSIVCVGNARFKLTTVLVFIR